MWNGGGEGKLWGNIIKKRELLKSTKPKKLEVLNWNIIQHLINLSLATVHLEKIDIHNNRS